jgi:hypothetical protein
MRVFLRSKKAGLYYGGAGGLTPALDEALEFASVPAAARLALSEKLPDVQIALRCDYLSHEVLLPVLSLWCEVNTDHTLPN